MTDAPQLALCTTAGDILDALVVRKEELGLSNAFIEEMAMLAPGEADKMLGPTRTRPLNVFKLGDLMEILAIDIVCVHSQAKAERMQAVWEKRETRNVRKPLRISKGALERAGPVIVSRNGSIGGTVTAYFRSAAEASKISRKANAARKRKLSRQRRAEIAQKAAAARWQKAKQDVPK